MWAADHNNLLLVLISSNHSIDDVSRANKIWVLKNEIYFRLNCVETIKQLQISRTRPRLVYIGRIGTSTLCQSRYTATFPFDIELCSQYIYIYSGK